MSQPDTPSSDPKPTGVVGALLALDDLKTAMATIRHSHPAYMPGAGPTAADNCANLFELMEHCLQMLGAYLDAP